MDPPRPPSTPLERSLSVAAREAHRGLDSPTLWTRTQPAELPGSPFSPTPVGTLDTSRDNNINRRASKIRSPTTTAPSPLATTTHVDYTTLPEVVQPKHECDSAPQARDTQYIPEDYPIPPKLAAEQHYRHLRQQRQQQHYHHPAIGQTLARSDVHDPASPGPDNQAVAATPVVAGAGEGVGVGEKGMIISAGPGIGGAAVRPGTAAPTVEAAEDGGAAEGAGGVSDTGAVDAGAADAGAAEEKHAYHVQKSRKTIWILVGLLALVVALSIIIGAAVGTKAVSDARRECAAASVDAGSDAPPTKTVTMTPSKTIPDKGSPTQTFTVPTQGFIQLDCPALTGSTQTVRMGSNEWAFEMSCGASFSRNARTDIMAIVSYNVFHCLQACASMNQNAGTTVCLGAEFDSDLGTALDFAGNCFLGNSTAVATAIASDAIDLKVSGILRTAKRSVKSTQD